MSTEPAVLLGSICTTGRIRGEPALDGGSQFIGAGGLRRLHRFLCRGCRILKASGRGVDRRKDIERDGLPASNLDRHLCEPDRLIRVPQITSLAIRQKQRKEAQRLWRVGE